MNLFKSFDGGLGQYMRNATRPRIYSAGVASGSTTMVVMFVFCLCCCEWYKNNLKMRLTVLHSAPHWREPYLLLPELAAFIRGVSLTKLSP